MVIEHYPQTGGSSKEDKEFTRPRRRADDRAVADDLPSGPAPVRAKKNTRRWCRGKAGVEHVTAWRKWPEGDYDSRWQHYVQYCTVCGKHLKSERRDT